jgi:hypothetical protein
MVKETENLQIWVKAWIMKKEKVIDTVKGLPQEFELEELIEKLVFVEKIEKGLRQAEEGKVTPH